MVFTISDKNKIKVKLREIPLHFIFFSIKSYWLENKSLRLRFFQLSEKVYTDSLDTFLIGLKNVNSHSKS